MAGGTSFGHDVLVIPGLRGSGPDHWQTKWEQAHPGFTRVTGIDWDRPDLGAWSAHVDAAIRRAPRAVLIVAHSFGCLAALKRASRTPAGIAGALLVAPACPERFGFEWLSSGARLPFPSILVASSDDPCIRLDRAQHLASELGSRFVNVGEAGHINAASGYGHWPYGLHLLNKLEVTAQAMERATHFEADPAANDGDARTVDERAAALRPGQAREQALIACGG